MLVVNSDTFFNWLKEHTELGIKIIKILCKRLNQTNKLIESLILNNQLPEILQIIQNKILDDQQPHQKSSNLSYHTFVNKLSNETQVNQELITPLIGNMISLGFMKIDDDETILLTKEANRILQNLYSKS